MDLHLGSDVFGQPGCECPQLLHQSCSQHVELASHRAVPPFLPHTSANVEPCRTAAGKVDSFKILEINAPSTSCCRIRQHQLFMGQLLRSFPFSFRSLSLLGWRPGSSRFLLLSDSLSGPPQVAEAPGRCSDPTPKRRAARAHGRGAPRPGGLRPFLERRRSFGRLEVSEIQR